MVDTPRVEQTADVDPRAVLGLGTTVWHLAQVRENARLGSGCVIGRGAYVGPGVLIGDNVKLQNYALVYEPAQLEDGVFIGPAAVLTNDPYPRSVDPAGRLKRAADWSASGVVVREGASLGARVVVVPDRTIGRWAMVAAGAVVTRDVPDFALVAGVPARQVGWVGRAGERLLAGAPGRWRCPLTGEMYYERDGLLTFGLSRSPAVGSDLRFLRFRQEISSSRHPGGPPARLQCVDYSYVAGRLSCSRLAA
jgi:UDP-2-acetamido-3-amino-2,3-dideoxy-glucuronate N-acetyltransferase